MDKDVSRKRYQQQSNVFNFNAGENATSASTSSHDIVAS